MRLRGLGCLPDLSLSKVAAYMQPPIDAVVRERGRLQHRVGFDQKVDVRAKELAAVTPLSEELVLASASPAFHEVNDWQR